MTQNKSIPVSIITGFLGSGKTTLLNQLIANNPDKKFAIIENEFGDISIDQELVVGVDEGVFELSNGCICCSLNNELGEVLQKLASNQYQFDHLLIETTGIAEPDAIASAFIGPGKGKTFVLDGTICIADAGFILKNIEERGEAVKQISFADAIILNKTDTIEAAEVSTIEQSLKKLNHDAPIIKAQYGKIETLNILKLQAYDWQRIEQELVPHHDNHSHDEHHDHHNHDHHHSDLTAHSFELKAPLDAAAFEHWMSMLVTFSGSQIYRIKGILNIKDEPNKIIFQSVRTSSKINIGNIWEDPLLRTTKIVFIGYNIERKPLEKGLNSCISK